MDVARLFFHLTPTGLQKVARRNCASSLVEQAVSHVERLDGAAVVVRAGVHHPAHQHEGTHASGH